jgi:hypothetical protein
MASTRSQPPKLGLFRILSQKSVWKEFWLSVRRAHKDKRARRHLAWLTLGVTLLLLLAVVVIIYVVVLVGTGSIFFAPLVIPILWWIRRSANKEFEPMNIAPQPTRVDPKVAAERHQRLRLYFADLGLLYAVLVDRAGSERFLKEKELPPGMEVTSRRTHMEGLRTGGLWERTALKDREAIMIPDGGWQWEQINRYATGIEPLRLLRWILRIDFRLPTVGQHLAGDFSVAHEIVVDPQRLRRGPDLIEEEAVREARDDARTTLLRCIAEAITRGYQPAEDEQTAAWAKGIAEELQGNQNEDFLLGDKLVSEATREQLGWATALANIRTDFLSMTLDVLEDGLPPDGPIASIFAEQDEAVTD